MSYFSGRRRFVATLCNLEKIPEQEYFGIEPATETRDVDRPLASTWTYSAPPRRSLLADSKAGDNVIKMPPETVQVLRHGLERP